MQKLNQAITAIDVFIPPKEYIKKILGAICDNLGYAFSTVIVLDEEGKGQMFASYNLPDDYLGTVHSIDAPVLSSPSGEAIETGKIVVVNDPLLDPRIKPWIDIVHQYSIKTQAWVPLFRGGSAFGTYVLYDTKKRQISDIELRTLEQIGVMVSIALTSNQYLNELGLKAQALETEVGERKNAEEALQIAHDELEMRVQERTADLFEANKELRLFRNLIDKTNDFLFISNPDTALILDVNASACTALGYEREELLRMTVMDVSLSVTDIYAWHNTAKKLINNGGGLIETNYRRKDGTVFPVEVSVSLIADGRNRFLVAVAHDITERRKAEEVTIAAYAAHIKDIEAKIRVEDALIESEKQYRLLFNSASDAIFIHNMRGQFLMVNDMACEVLGYSRDELLRMTPMDIDSPEYASVVPKQIKRVRTEGHAIFESAHVAKDGTLIPVEINSRLIEYGGQPCMLSIVRDITERKKMLEKLRDSQLRLTLKNKIANIFLTSSNEDMYTDVLNAVLDNMQSKYGIFGYLDKNGAMVCPSVTRSVWEECQVPDKTITFPHDSWSGLWGKSLTEKKALYSNEGFSVPEGHIPISNFLAVPIIYQDAAIGAINVANKAGNYDEADRDLLESIARHIAPVLNARLERDYRDEQRRMAENTLKASEEKYSTIVEKGNDGIVIIQDGIIVFTNEIEAAISGFSIDEMYGKSFLEFVMPEYRELVDSCYKSRLQGDHAPNGYEMEIVSKSGKGIPVETNACIIEYEGRRATLVFIRDRTEYRKAEKEIRDVKNYLETIIEMSYDGILVMDSEGRFEFGNDAFYNMVEWPQDELIGESFIKVIPEDHHNFMLKRWDEVQRGEGEPYDTVIVTKNGKRKNLLVSHTHMEYAGERKYCVIVKDITIDIEEYMKLVSDIVNNLE